MGVSDFAMGQRTVMTTAGAVHSQSKIMLAEFARLRSSTQLQSIALLRWDDPLAHHGAWKIGLSNILEILMEVGRK